MERTRNRRYGKKILFISDTNQLGDVTKNVLSCWIAATINLAYETIGDRVLRNVFVKPHEIRTISGSINFNDSFDTITAMNAGVWIGRQTFDRIYVRDVAVGPGSTRRIQTVVAAQHVVSLVPSPISVQGRQICSV